MYLLQYDIVDVGIGDLDQRELKFHCQVFGPAELYLLNV